MVEERTTVTLPNAWIVGICVAGAAAGLGAAFLVDPAVSGLLSLVGDAPGPLRLAAGLPLMWAIPVLTLAGLGVGIWIVRHWRTDVGVVEVAKTGVTVEREGVRRLIDRDRIAGVFTDGRDLVITDGRGGEVSRTRTDRVLVKRLRQAFEGFGYPWQGEVDPYERAYRTWVDGSGDLDSRAHGLLRARGRALADRRTGAADDALDELRALGVAVRDRDNKQQYRVIPPS
ncbi:hypothetical protein SAMN05421776_106162 [Nocardia farcinica]|uniref:Uncharacterized protein n=2 Tax=Nocardia farcinica TaxID=37329 RepID=A0A0H5P510_NOCFR|nr:hypothetical protein [Nocardia farcinica]AXK87897.1 hypothetical protein DXT66_21780 [Nocardia farcinica]MBA4858111.1 hypothetical protein [Nocardia farcinica]MBC9816641.1 hypothetical protein [Nocardia farcinica]MBF6293955.1 hypothetical protein [Nocardia farcinica]MBF6380370.1 hypothetical protein [Nocardia farcinica]